MSDELGKNLAQIFNSTGLAEVVRVTGSESQIALLHRVKDKKAWLLLVEYVLKRKSCWDAHICQQYFLRGRSLVYGWNFILEPEEGMEAALMEIATLFEKGLQELPKMASRGMVNSFPLMGASPRRTANIAFDVRAPGPARGGPSQKGAHNIRG